MPLLLLAALALVFSGAFSLAPGLSAPAGATTPTSFTFTGSGWGHGVGMSQWGARGMAAAGKTWGEILNHYYTGVAVTTRPTSDDLRVLLSERQDSITLTAGGATSLSGVGSISAGQSVTLRRSGSGLAVSGARTGTLGGATLVQFAGNGDLKLSSTGNSYRYGVLVVSPDPRGGVRAVLVNLTMRQYLYGLGEMPSSWPAEALKAQVAAGRTFAQKRRDARSTADFDLYSTVVHQAYTGTKFDAPAWRAAVDATEDRVITYQGALIDAVYSASSGGHTEHSEIVWVAPVPYLRGVADPADATPGNPHTSWSRTYTGAQLGSWFGLGTVTSVRIVSAPGASGRVDKGTIRLTGTGGTKDVSGASFRITVNNRMPSATLRSTRFTVAGSTGGSTTPPPASPPSGKVTLAAADGRTIVIAGTATDPDGAPLVRVVSTMGTTRATRETRAVGGAWRVSWDGSPGTRNVCVSLLDTPTGQAVSLGCRDVVVK